MWKNNLWGICELKYVRSVQPGPGEDWQSRTYSSKKFRNISRNFHAWINEENKTLPVEVSTVKLRVLERRPKMKEVARDFDWFEGMGRVLTSRGT